MIRKLIHTLLLAGLMLAGWCLWILTLTTGGLKLDLALIAHFLPGTLAVEQVEGSLLGGFSLQKLAYRYPAWGIQASLDTLTLSWHGTTSGLTGTLTIELADLNAFSDSLHGKLNGTGKLGGSLLKPVLTGTVTGSDLAIAGQPLGNPLATLTLGLKPAMRVWGQLHLASSLETLPPLVTPWVKKPAGNLSLDLVLGGFLMHPVLTGTAQLSHASFTFPSTGIHPDHIDLAATLHSDWHIHFQGSFMAGGGEGKVEGSLQDEKLSLTVQGNNLQAANLTHWQVALSPSLSLTLTRQALDLKGSILIPEALITTSEVSGVVTLPDDVIYVEANHPVASLPFLTALQLDVRLGEHIQIATANLKTTLTGQLQLHQVPGGPITGTGELMIPKKGVNTFMAYGQTLTITSGQLFFAGGLITNPGLAITAVKTIQAVNMGGGSSSFTSSTGLQPVYTGRQTITVGAHVSGSLSEPSISLFSDPSMSQADMLSYLIFGYPRSEISGQQTGMLLTALSALSPDSMPNSASLTEKLQNKLGITELNLESTQFFNPATSSTVSTTALVIGKQIAPKLSLHYSVGLFYPVSVLNLRYQFNKNWALQSENSTIDNGADLLFGIERD